MFEKDEDWPEFAALRSDLESWHSEIKAEALSLMDSSGAFKPWHEPEIYEGGWDVYGLFWSGREIERKTLAPITKEIVGAWQPLVFNAGFSLLRPGVLIKPHIGYTADVLRLHLGVSAPCGDPREVGLRVGAETKGWIEGRTALFDDTIEHEAWNKSGLPRVVLLVDVLRPKGREKGRRQ